MKTCLSCRNQNAPSSRFCGNCGEPLATSGSGMASPDIRDDSSPHDPRVEKINAFIKGRVFAAVVVVLSAIGIIYAMMNGGLSSGRAPLPAEAVDPWRPSETSPWRSEPRARTPENDNRRPGSAGGRLRASEEERGRE